MRRGLSSINIVSLVLGLLFLYVPIAILIVYSFNASRLVSVWGGWSMRWYAALLNDQPLLDAASASLRIAFVSASIATVLGTLAAVTLVRGGRFRGRTGFAALIYAPIVMPEVITGLALLLLFVAADVERGFWTVTIAHTTVTMCFAALIVQSRLVSFDQGLEEAAVDLGCPPLRAFFAITLPLIWPTVASAWILAFTLSLDDFVLASFCRLRHHHAADPHLFGCEARRETGDQRDLHTDDRLRRRGVDRVLIADAKVGGYSAGRLSLTGRRSGRRSDSLRRIAPIRHLLDRRADRFARPPAAPRRTAAPPRPSAG